MAVEECRCLLILKWIDAESRSDYFLCEAREYDSIEFEYVATAFSEIRMAP
jgi:hypothetical protein